MVCENQGPHLYSFRENISQTGGPESTDEKSFCRRFIEFLHWIRSMSKRHSARAPHLFQCMYDPLSRESLNIWAKVGHMNIQEMDNVAIAMAKLYVIETCAGRTVHKLFSHIDAWLYGKQHDPPHHQWEYMPRGTTSFDQSSIPHVQKNHYNNSFWGTT